MVDPEERIGLVEVEDGPALAAGGEPRIGQRRPAPPLGLERFQHERQRAMHQVVADLGHDPAHVEAHLPARQAAAEVQVVDVLRVQLGDLVEGGADDRGRQVRLYDISPEYRAAIAHKAEQTSNEIMGVYVKPDPLSPEALMQAAEADMYHAKRTQLFEIAGGKDPVKAAEARLQILQLGTDPQFAEIRNRFERTERETKPLETALKETGPWIVNTFPQGTEAEMQAEAARRNAENFSARPGGLGDGGVSGPANTTFK